MRADRLVALLLFLQRRPNGATAAEVAAELEVSERTARRDLEGLTLAGLPVYSSSGRGGGWRLLGGGKIDLSGLTGPEMRALFALAGPRAPTSPALKAAVRKLTRALPETLRDDAETLSRSIIVEPPGWQGSHAPADDPPLLDDIQRAVVARRELELDYQRRDGERSTRVIRPLGLVMKGQRWYLIADTETGRRTFRVDRMAGVRSTDRRFASPADFDLTDAWRTIVDEFNAQAARFSTTVLVRSSGIGPLRTVLRDGITIGSAEKPGWIRCEVRSYSTTTLSIMLAGFVGQVRVADPAIRKSLAKIGRQLVDEYG